MLVGEMSYRRDRERLSALNNKVQSHRREASDMVNRTKQ